VIYPVLCGNHDKLIRIILRHCPLESTLYTDFWSAYYNNRAQISKLAPYGCIHYVVNDSRQFVSSFSNEIHINTIERTWRTIKSYIRMLSPRILIYYYIAKIYLNEIYTKNEIFQIQRILRILSSVRVNRLNN